MTTKKIANRPKVSSGSTSNKKSDIYRWVARGKTKLVAIHVVGARAYIQPYLAENTSSPTYWSKDGDMITCNVIALTNGTENPGSGYQVAELHIGLNRVGYLLVATGGNAKPKQTDKVILSGNRMGSRKIRRMNRREHHTLIYRTHDPVSAESGGELSEAQRTKLNQLQEELKRLDSKRFNQESTPLLWSLLFPSGCDEPPSDVLLEEEEYEVTTTTSNDPLLNNDYFPIEYEYDYDYGTETTDP